MAILALAMNKTVVALLPFMSELAGLWREVENCNSCNQSYNPLQHVFGGGQEKHPDFALVFINPTHQNISTSPSWRGPRFPFIGTRAVWRVLVKSGILPNEVLEVTEETWREKSAEKLLALLRENSIYLTNVVKCTAPHSNLPPMETVREKMHILFKELQIVQPRLTVAMGLLPFKVLTGETVKLSNFSTVFPIAPYSFPSKIGAVVPCWFPVGRGNPTKSAELLSAIARQ